MLSKKQQQHCSWARKERETAWCGVCSSPRPPNESTHFLSSRLTIWQQPLFLKWKNKTEHFETEKSSGPNFSFSSKFSHIFFSFPLLLACLVLECDILVQTLTEVPFFCLLSLSLFSKEFYLKKKRILVKIGQKKKNLSQSNERNIKAVKSVKLGFKS